MATTSQSDAAAIERSEIAAEKITNSHPLYVHPSDTPSLVLILMKLTGSENYGLWRQSMTIALQAKRKLGFIMNTVSADILSGIVYASDAGSVWKDLKERFNEVKNIRIFQLHRGIAMNSLGTYSVVVYFTKLRELWAEYDALVPSPSCDYARSMDYIEHLQRQHLLQFLSGLNESYE
ncbi:hypothetical protein P3S68_003382 [Capsicum galapagoense]